MFDSFWRCNVLWTNTLNVATTLKLYVTIPLCLDDNVKHVFLMMPPLSLMLSMLLPKHAPQLAMCNLPHHLITYNKQPLHNNLCTSTYNTIVEITFRTTLKKIQNFKSYEEILLQQCQNVLTKHL
jgi:hypothetical protein